MGRERVYRTGANRCINAPEARLEGARGLAEGGAQADARTALLDSPAEVYRGAPGQGPALGAPALADIVITVVCSAGEHGQVINRAGLPPSTLGKPSSALSFIPGHVACVNAFSPTYPQHGVCYATAVSYI